MFNYWRMYPIVANPLSRASDYVRLILQCLYAGLSVFFLCEYVYYTWKRKVMSMWVCWEVIKLSIPVVMIVFILVVELTYFDAAYLARFISSTPDQPNGFVDAFEDGRLLNYISTFSCLNLIIHMIQIFKLLSWSSLFTLVFSALVEACKLSFLQRFIDLNLTCSSGVTGIVADIFHVYYYGGSSRTPSVRVMD